MSIFKRHIISFSWRSSRHRSGQMLVEILLTMGLAALIFPAILTGFLATREGKPEQIQRMQAITLLKETEEAVRNIRNKDWTTLAGLSGQGALHPVISGSSWATASGSETINTITRQFVVSEVYRNNGTIVSVGGTDDASTKRVDITVSWTQPYSTSIVTTLYLTRTTNLTNTDTLYSDFAKGTVTNAAVATTSGTFTGDGQVQLGAGGAGGDWCQPGSNVLATFDLPGSGVVQNITATSGATQNIAYTTTGGNASGDAVDGLTISHATPTPTIANPHSNNDAKAYGIYVDNAGQYVYFNENNSPNHTVQIANASDLSDLGYFDVSHTTAQSVFVSGNTGYTVAGSTLYSFDVSAKTGSRPQLGSVALGGNGKRVIVVGTNAYVATDSTTKQLQIVNVSNPASMSVTKTINLGNNLAGVDVYVNSSQTYAYVVTTYSAGKNDFYIVDLPNASSPYGYVTVNGMNPNGIAVVSGNRAILVGSGGEEYEVFNIANPALASHCGGMSPAGTTSVKAVAPVSWNGVAYSYILTDNSTAEFQVVLGGAGGQFSSSGTYESATFDPGFNTAFNKFIADVAVPAATSISAQVAVAPAVNNSCSGATFTYVGPSGTTNTNDRFLPTNGQIIGLIPLSTVSPNYQNPSRCFRYKYWYTSSDSTQTPELYDITVNYSP